MFSPRQRECPKKSTLSYRYLHGFPLDADKTLYKEQRSIKLVRKLVRPKDNLFRIRLNDPQEQKAIGVIIFSNAVSLNRVKSPSFRNKASTELSEISEIKDKEKANKTAPSLNH